MSLADGHARPQVDWTNLKPIQRDDGDGVQAVLWFDIDNCLYSKSMGIAPLMSQKIHDYFVFMGYPEQEAWDIHQKYYKHFGLAIRGLQEHHSDFDAEDFDRKCDGSLPLEDLLHDDPLLRDLLSSIDRSKVRVLALTNAYKPHALRVLRILGVTDQFEAVISCKYTQPGFPAKPDKAYYDIAMQLSGVSHPSKHYFVDDSALNVKGAAAQGWNAWHFDEDGTAQIPAGTIAGSVQSLQDLRQHWKAFFIS